MKLYLVIAGGVTLLLVLCFQIAVGKRWIRFPGALHLKIHRWTALAMLALALFHGTFAIGALALGWL